MVAYGTEVVNARTKAMLTEVERLSGIKLTVVQGYNPGGVEASGGTHDGQGVVDLRAITLTPLQRNRVVLNCRRVGFAAWLRNPSQGSWPYHIHAVAIKEDKLSKAAKNQVTDYRNDRNGLANGNPDYGPTGYRDYINVDWESYQKEHPLPTPGGDMSAQDVKAINDYTADVSSHITLHIDQMKDDFGNYAADTVVKKMAPQFSELKVLLSAINANLTVIANAVSGGAK